MPINFNHPPVKAFVSERDAFCRELKTKAKIIYEGQEMEGIVQWDTGASGTCISKRVIDALNPKRRGYRTVLTPTGSSIRGVYLLDIVLPNDVLVPDINVIETDIDEQGIDALIGMDIIAMGDFAVSNYDGKLVFTFRIPSIKRTDYVAEVQAENLWVNTQTHGKGQRKKKR